MASWQETCARALLTARCRIERPARLRALRGHRDLKVYYGCGLTRQPGYINVDLRWTPAVDLLGDLEWCAREFAGCCDEVFMSHVLEHYGSPGKAMNERPGTVLDALRAAHRMLASGGALRIAVPDFGALARLHAEGVVSLYPKLLGRIVGAQNYRENVHRCAFDRPFLELCMRYCGFEAFETWDPREMRFEKDASFDEVEGVRTSLNLIARKASSA